MMKLIFKQCLLVKIITAYGAKNLNFPLSMSTDTHHCS